MRREFDTREYSERVYYERPGRETHDTRSTYERETLPKRGGTW